MNFTYSHKPQDVFRNIQNATKLTIMGIGTITPLLIALLATSIFPIVYKIDIKFYLFYFVFLHQLITFPAILNSMHAIATGEKITLYQSLKSTFKKFGPLFDGYFRWNILVLTGLICFIIPALIFYISTIFYVPLIMLEGNSGKAAVGKSGSLIWGFWGKTCLTYFIPALPLPILYFVCRYFVESYHISKPTLSICTAHK
ncbi:MAG: hypothetical protein HRU09_17710 [Oligoflexales bacterium]|nr:hypothetical protein [Oligoflexales bacterium]